MDSMDNFRERFEALEHRSARREYRSPWLRVAALVVR